MRSASVERLAAGILAVEAIGLTVLAGWEVVALASGDSDSVGSSLALIALTLIGVAALVAFAVAVVRGNSWGRSGGIVAQLLLLAVAVGALTGPDPLTGVAVPLAVPGVAGLVLLVAAVRRAGGDGAR